ncbi:MULTISPECIES: hypothetical protein [unclassified Thermoactinomyces]|jgi:hypothetical protein|uniref:hypothetical protein n=1 Tax=unclassified Thermoactinomyces TaxID=2634588 RepID=UPI0018DBC04F|nr:MULTISPECIES: hypothetical protein [unclassified Thermoactinomyces]MBH8599243.1 hypothetical protein [Thermoactinomyces sp. CICC 10523]MBH8605555.1 hypothetical protein [Thermoactinomyces sp. CICC 10522]MBH8608990.1 hypothetical protein [Thermoactinomyces sp. CICC 10521]
MLPSEDFSFAHKRLLDPCFLQKKEPTRQKGLLGVPISAESGFPKNEKIITIQKWLLKCKKYIAIGIEHEAAVKF